MRVRQLVGGHRGEVVEMPYAIAQRAMQTGTVEAVDLPPELQPAPRLAEVSVPLPRAEADLPPPTVRPRRQRR